MTPAARVSAAIEILDRIISGDAAERALTTWARGSRFAGSKDRAAVRDHVFEALRCWRSFAWLGGGASGRALMLGALRDANISPKTIFSGEGHAPARLGPDDSAGQSLEAAPLAVRCDMPDWLMDQIVADLGDRAETVCAVLRHRAAVHLRVNLSRTTRDDAARMLADEGITTRPLCNVKTGLQVTENERRVVQSAAYLEGMVELQDSASQQAIARCHITPDMRVLDFCAGGGGKALALADRSAEVFAHDIDPNRMRDIPQRAQRAGVDIARLDTSTLAGNTPFDMVFCDSPCSGSGTWRRAPDAKWRLTPDRLNDLNAMQDSVLDQAADLVAPQGQLIYATCSFLTRENRARVDAFLERTSGWQVVDELRLLPASDQDGFYLAVIARV